MVAAAVYVLEVAVSAACYAALYAARAALSEQDRHARTHRGTWHIFRERFVDAGAFDEQLHSLAQQAQTAREGGDYEAITPDPRKAEMFVSGARDSVAAVEHMLGVS